MTTKEKPLEYWKNNAEEDYLKVPISVLRYISILEEIVGKNNNEDSLLKFILWYQVQEEFDYSDKLELKMHDFLKDENSFIIE